MLKLTSENMVKAIEQARRIKPRVRVLSEREYEVKGRHGEYRVRFEKRDGVKLGECSCTAGRLYRICYHLAAAAGVHVQRMFEAGNKPSQLAA